MCFGSSFTPLSNLNARYSKRKRGFGELNVKTTVWSSVASTDLMYFFMSPP
jgi:hypothetical protein